jgi:hypothetical protein
MVIEITPHNPLYSRRFQYDEEILKELQRSDSPWDALHHRALFLLFMDKFMSADTDQSPQIHLDLEQAVTEYYSFPRSKY